MNHFIYFKPIWSYRNWNLSPRAENFIDSAPDLTPPIDFKFISNTFSRLLPKVQRQIVLDFGGDDDINGD